MATDVKELFSDLDAGVFENKIGVALSEVAQGVLNNRAKGSVIIEINLEAMNEMQVMLSHKLKFTKPTSRGKSSEEDTTHTPMYVGRGGNLSLHMEDQEQLFSKDGKIINISAVN